MVSPAARWPFGRGRARRFPPRGRPCRQVIARGGRAGPFCRIERVARPVGGRLAETGMRAEGECPPASVGPLFLDREGGAAGRRPAGRNGDASRRRVSPGFGRAPLLRLHARMGPHTGRESSLLSSDRAHAARARPWRRWCASAGHRAGARRGGPGGGSGVCVSAERRRRLGSLAGGSGSQRRLAGVAGRPAAGPGHRALERALRGADGGDVRELPARADRRAAAVAADARRRDRAGERDSDARPAADLPGCVRLPVVRAARRPARARSVHAHGRRSVCRPDVRVHRLAVPALALRAAVHAAELRARAARAGRRAVGVQGDRRRQQPGRGRADRARGRASRALARLGGGVRGAQSGDARAGGGRGAQRHAGGARAGGGAGAERPARSAGGLPSPRRVGAGRGRRREADGRAGAPVPGALQATCA